jgi:hypothetical protein
MTFQQLLAQARVYNPEITSLHVEATVYTDGDAYLRYEAHVPGEQISGDTVEELLANIRDERKAA